MTDCARARYTYLPNGRRRRTPEFQAWIDMRKRCRHPQNPSFANYGGRGIGICDRWNRFEEFMIDMGARPDGGTIERVDNDKSYSPDNCRWVSRAAQARNRRTTRLEPHEPAQIRWLHSEGATVRELARFFDVSDGAVRSVVNGLTWRESK